VISEIQSVETIAAICDEFESYGCRRVRAELRHGSLIVDHKKIRRFMREHDVQPRRRRRHVATIDSDSDEPISPNRTKDPAINGEPPRSIVVESTDHLR
jgi:putative transposase